MQAFARLDAVGMCHYLCEDAGVSMDDLRQGMAEARSQGAHIELSEMRFQLLELSDDTARVRMVGIIVSDHPTQGPHQERLDEEVRCRVEHGRWKVCGELM